MIDQDSKLLAPVLASAWSAGRLITAAPHTSPRPISPTHEEPAGEENPCSVLLPMGQPVDDRHTYPTALTLRSSSSSSSSSSSFLLLPRTPARRSSPPYAPADARAASVARRRGRPFVAVVPSPPPSHHSAGCVPPRLPPDTTPAPVPRCQATHDAREVMQVLLSPNDRPRFETPSSRACQCVERRASDHRVFRCSSVHAAPCRRPCPRLSPATLAHRLCRSSSTGDDSPRLSSTLLDSPRSCVVCGPRSAAATRTSTLLSIPAAAPPPHLRCPQPSRR